MKENMLSHSATRMVARGPCLPGKVAKCWRARCSHRSHEAEEARHRAAVTIGWRFQKENQRCPECAEGRKAHRAKQCRLPQQGVAAHEMQLGAHQVRPGDDKCREAGWQLRSHDRRENQNAYRCNTIDRAPAKQRPDPSTKSAREQHTEKYSTHHRADDAPPLFVRRKMGGEGDHDMHICRKSAHSETGGGETYDIRSDSEKQERCNSAKHQDSDQRAALEFIAQRHEKKHPHSGAHLAEHGDCPGLGDSETEAVRDVGEERLRIIYIGHDHAHGGRNEPDHRSAHGFLFTRCDRKR